MNRKKKILFICQYFYPEVFRGNDVAFHWAKAGHDVHVVAGIPNYPDGVFHKGYGIFRNRHEVINGVRVTRVPIFPRGNNKVMLMLNYFSYFVVAWVYILFHAIRHKYDVVFCQQLSPVMMSSPAILYKKLRRTPLYTWVLDIWPESLTAAGGVKNKYILGFFDLFVKSEYKNSDRILTSSRSFNKAISTYGDYDDKLVYFPQWADGSIGESGSSSGYSLPDIPSGFVVMFAGAVGEAHGMECNMHAALLTKEYKDIHWVIVGDGRKLNWVQNYVKENELGDTVHTLGRFPSDTMLLFFEKADVMLVSLNDSPLFNMYAPAKISSYMAAGRPIIAALNGEGREVVEDAKCGWSVSAGDAKALADLVVELSKTDKTLLKEKGDNGLKYYNEYFEKERCLRNLDEKMKLSEK